MSLKRYLPKYKKLLRFKYPIWFEKRVKLRKFEKQKWERVKKFYYKRRIRRFFQTSPSSRAARRYYKDVTVRGFKTYRFLLNEKQKLQTYYGVGRFRYYQLKNMARNVSSKTVDNGKTLLFKLENRLDTLLYRLLLVNSLPIARRLIKDKRIKVDFNVISNIDYGLKAENILSLDVFLKNRIVDYYLRSYMPYFYFRNKKKRKVLKKERREIWEKSFLNKIFAYSFFSLTNFQQQKRLKKKVFVS